MKKRAMYILGCGVLASLSTFGADEKTFKREIADSQCALNVHSLNQSHKEMIGMTPSIKTDAECVRYCVKERGGRFVLQTKEKVYKLDRQDLAEQNIGHKVRVTGTLDLKTDIITVLRIEAIPDSVTVPNVPKKQKE
jgi:hypothetical protein